jgi:hypothetical protein
MSNKLVKTTKYTVEEFCKKYNETNLEQVKQSLLEKVMNPHYVPYEMKITICEKIIENSYYKKNNDGVKKLHINSPAQYMLYCLWLVKQYTYIEVDLSKSLEEFNMLNECGLIDCIIDEIPEKECMEFDNVLDMIKNDVIKNEYEIHAFISNQVERFGELFGHVTKPALDRFSEVLENMDENAVDNVINKLNKFSESKGLNGVFNIVK